MRSHQEPNMANAVTVYTVDHYGMDFGREALQLRVHVPSVVCLNLLVDEVHGSEIQLPAVLEQARRSARARPALSLAFRWECS